MLDVSAEVVITEFKNFYPICNQKWVAGEYVKDLKDGNVSFWKHLLSLYSISYPNICKLVEINFSIAGNTVPLERSYSKLAKLYPKDRNKLSKPPMETQCIIGILKDWDFDYESARKSWDLLCDSDFPKFAFKLLCDISVFFILAL